jgi:hypothetical protein
LWPTHIMRETESDVVCEDVSYQLTVCTQAAAYPTGLRTGVASVNVAISGRSIVTTPSGATRAGLEFEGTARRGSRQQSQGWSCAA